MSSQDPRAPAPVAPLEKPAMAIQLTASGPPIHLLALIGFVTSLFSFAVFTLILATTTFILTRIASREIEASTGRIGGTKLLRSANVLALLAIALYVVGLITGQAARG